jgi:hypothetical protein
MARRAKPGAKEETALVPTKVVRSEFIEGDESNALSNTVESLAQQNTELMRLMSETYKHIVLERKIMADTVNDTLKQQIELTKAHQELLDKKEDRKLKRQREQRHDEMIEKGMKEFLALVPVLAAKFSKQPVLARKESVMLHGFVSNLSQAELQGIFDTLSPTNRAAMIEMLKAIPDEVDEPLKPPEGGTNGAH